ncbi:MAG: thioredoxin [Bacilli bacterium]
MVKHLGKDEDLLEIIGKDLYLVDFYADWCGPCKMLAPILEQIDFINVIKVNVDEHQNLASQFGVMSIPTLIFFKDGLLEKKEIGFRNIEEIKNIVNNL